jgi:hypothetical protein
VDDLADGDFASQHLPENEGIEGQQNLSPPRKVRLRSGLTRAECSSVWTHLMRVGLRALAVFRPKGGMRVLRDPPPDESAWLQWLLPAEATGGHPNS